MTGQLCGIQNKFLDKLSSPSIYFLVSRAGLPLKTVRISPIDSREGNRSMILSLGKETLSEHRTTEKEHAGPPACATSSTVCKFSSRWSVCPLEPISECFHSRILLVSMLQHWKSQCNWHALSLWFLWFCILEVSMLMFGRNQHNSVKDKHNLSFN